MSDAAVVILADHAAGFVGEPSPLAESFGGSPSLLRATVDRVLAAQVAEVVVCHRDAPANRELAALVDGVRVVCGPADANDASLVGAALAATGARDAIVVDACWPFVSGALLRAQLAAHRASGNELTFARMAATGLGGVVVSRAAVERLARALASWPLKFDTGFFEFCDAVRPAFDAAEIHVPPELVCMPASLSCATLDDARRLAPFHGDATYDRVFDAECRAAWSLARRPREVPARPRMLVTAFTTSGEPGGTVALEILLEHLERFEIVVALPNRGTLFERLAPRFPTRVLPIHWRSAGGEARWAADVVACGELLRAEQPDLVYINGAAAPMAVACRATGVPAIVHLHLPILRLGAQLSSHVARQTCVPLHAAVITPARTAKQLLDAAFRPPPGRVIAIECGIPTARFDPARHDGRRARERFELAHDAQVISVVGMLVPIKRPEVAVDTLAELAERFPRAVLVFAGAERLHSGYHERLAQRAAERGIANRVRFLGHVDGVPDVYAASDVVLHCAVGDTFPLVLLEAMAMARPVVALADGGATESVVDGVTGRLVAMPGSPAACAAAIGDVLGDPAAAARMGAAGRERAIRHYDAAAYAQRIQRVCERVIAGEPVE